MRKSDLFRVFGLLGVVGWRRQGCSITGVTASDHEQGFVCFI